MSSKNLIIARVTIIYIVYTTSIKKQLIDVFIFDINIEMANYTLFSPANLLQKQKVFTLILITFYAHITLNRSR